MFLLPIPGSVIGMMLMTVSLQSGLVKLDWVKDAAHVLVKNMAFFFIPPGSALILYLDLIEAEFVPIVVALVVSTFLVLAVSSYTLQLLERK